MQQHIIGESLTDTVTGQRVQIIGFVGATSYKVKFTNGTITTRTETELF